jgi:hypothetical protein
MARKKKYHPEKIVEALIDGKMVRNMGWDENDYLILNGEFKRTVAPDPSLRAVNTENILRKIYENEDWVIL